MQLIPHVGCIPKVQLLLDHFQYLKSPDVLELADLSAFSHAVSSSTKTSTQRAWERNPQKDWVPRPAIMIEGTTLKISISRGRLITSLTGPHREDIGVSTMLTNVCVYAVRVSYRTQNFENVR